MIPLCVQGVGIIGSEKIDINKDGDVIHAWFYIKIKKGGRYLKSGHSKYMTYRCHLRCKESSPKLSNIIKGRMIELRGVWVHNSVYDKLSNSWNNFNYIDLNNDETGMRWLTPRDTDEFNNYNTQSEIHTEKVESEGNVIKTKTDEKLPF